MTSHFPNFGLALVMIALAACTPTTESGLDASSSQTPLPEATQSEVRAHPLALDLRGVDPALTVEPTQVMVLGTAHLRGMDGLDMADLDPLMDRLAAFAPDVITIEGVPGEVCETLRAYPSEYPGVADTYCQDPAPYQAESGLSAAEGAARVRETLGDWPDTPDASARRALAAAFLAAGEPYSAVVQWHRLPEGERVAGDGLGPDSVAALDARSRSLNESNAIAARLAARLGLERVFSADDHSSDIVIANYGDAFWERMGEIWPSRDGEFYATYSEAQSRLVEGNALAAYRFYNAPETQLGAVNNDFRQAMNDSEGEQYGRRYNAWYQVRNLRMVASVVAAAATEPGGRVLSVVGASHKPYFESYLDQMHDIAVVSTDTVLQ